MGLSRAGTSRDAIRIKDLIVPLYLRSGAHWPLESDEPIEQPIAISVSVFYDVSQTAQSDDLAHSLDYADIASSIRHAVMLKAFACIQDVSSFLCDAMRTFPTFSDRLDGLEMHITVKQLKAPLHTKTIAVELIVRFSSDGHWAARDIIHVVQDLLCPAIIGVSVAERLEKQDVILNLSIETGSKGLNREEWIDLRGVTRILYEEISTSSFLTLEALASCIASETLTILKSSIHSPEVVVRISKPYALTLASASEVEIYRSYADFSDDSAVDGGALIEVERATAASELHENESHMVAIALGSNLGDSFRNIEFALRLLECPSEILTDHDITSQFEPSVTIVNTSFLYKTTPMYVTDQPSFINCACLVETNISPRLFLQLLKAIEAIVGRTPSVRFGPRAVDLDIIFYGNDIIDTRSDVRNLDDLEGELVIPHPRMFEREFVLRPLNDMIPNYIHPVLKKSVKNLFEAIFDPAGTSMDKVIPYPRHPMSTSSPYPSISPVPETLTYWTFPSAILHRSNSSSKAHIMATLNITPDSFSDGSKHGALPAAMNYVCSSISSGATIIDIGGYSTRPGAAFVSTQEEVDRIEPTISALRNGSILREMMADEASEYNLQLSDELFEKIISTPISVDTFRWEVAEAAIKAGANCINDVYAFTGPDSWPLPTPDTEARKKVDESLAKMKAVVRKYNVPVVLMHSRGDAGKNKDYTQYNYAADSLGIGSVLEGVRVELGKKIDDIVLGKGGVRRWLVIADPGIGFSKTVDGNLEVLSSAKKVVLDCQIGGKDNIVKNPLTGYPQLIGVSRKSFLGAVLSKDPNGRHTEPRDRHWATAAAVACAVQQGAVIVRVHDVKEMIDVVKVSEALWPLT